VRLGDLAGQVRATASDPDADAVHDLRVAIRRFGQSLSIYGSLLPKPAMRKIRKRLDRMMGLAGEIRDRDIAVELFAEAGLSKSDELWRRIRSDRRASEKKLLRRVKRWNRGDFSAKWRSSLQLDR
jgi:CHAD domain-containing protein